MRTFRLLRILILGIMAMLAVDTMAQSSGDKLYNQGLELQKVQTVASQQSAINKFTSAKKLYDSATKKKQCDDAIVVSNNIIKTLKSGKKPKTETKKVDVSKDTLQFNKDSLFLDNASQKATVEVITNMSEWKVNVVDAKDVEAFVTVETSTNSNVVEISCSANETTKARQLVIELSAGDIKQNLVVCQKGKPITLNVSSTLMDFASKGGTKTYQVYSNCDDVYSENNQLNWHVVSKPDWINIVGEKEKAKNTINVLTKTVKGLAKGVAQESSAEDVITTNMNVVSMSKAKTDPSRSGEIIIESGDKRITILVQQK